MSDAKPAVKRLIDRIKRPRLPQPSNDDAGFFSSAFSELPEAAPQCISWGLCAQRVGAQTVATRDGEQLFVDLWEADRHMVALTPADLKRMSRHFEFVTVPANRELICQDELGDYMMIVLDGTLSVDRVQPWGARARLAEARAGDMLGEMSLIDAGTRFSSCVTLSRCLLAVIDAQRLDQLMVREPRLGVALLASMSRRLSLRLRQVSARLSALLSQN